MSISMRPVNGGSWQRMGTIIGMKTLDWTGCGCGYGYGCTQHAPFFFLCFIMVGFLLAFLSHTLYSPSLFLSFFLPYLE